MSKDLADRLQQQYDRFKAFPESGKQGEFFLVRSEAFLAFLEARQLIEREAIPALHRLPPVAPPWGPIASYHKAPPETPDVLVDAGSGLGFWDEDDRVWRDSTNDERIEPRHWMPMPERPE